MSNFKRDLDRWLTRSDDDPGMGEYEEGLADPPNPDEDDLDYETESDDDFVDEDDDLSPDGADDEVDDS